jgi:tetratricopeptide (TPR) repeat protein
MTFVISRAQLIGVATAILLSSCSQMPTSTDNSIPQTTATEIPKEELTGENLFQLLLAEIATNRRELGAAAALYGELSDNYNDTSAISRAVALNQSIGNYAKMLELSQKWISLRPNDPEALRALTLSAIANGEIELGTTSLTQWLTADPKADVSLILPGAKNLSDDQIAGLNSELSMLQTQFKRSPSLLYTRARIELSIGNPNQALTLIDQSLKIEDNFQVRLFQYQVVLANEDIPKAKKLIEQLDKNNPNNRQVGIQYARFIYAYEPQNLDKLQELHTRFAMEPTISRTYARAAFDQEEYDSAQAVFLHLLNHAYADEAHYFLGRIDIKNGNLEAAANHFESVQNTPYVTSALAEWASMARVKDEERFIAAIQKGQSDYPDLATTMTRLEASYFQLTLQSQRAWQTLGTALELNPNDIRLLYDQAMLSAEINRFDVMEKNLSTIIEIDPENTNALNALGYTWADQNKNLEQASIYIDKALESNPDNAAFQDSKGWLLYRQGDLDGALIWLKKAYAQLKNDEVAAHIAEVLWHLDRNQDAKTYLNEVIRLNPDSIYVSKLNELFSQ